MSAEIEDLVGQFEARTLSRRELVAALAGLVAARRARRRRRSRRRR